MATNPNVGVRSNIIVCHVCTGHVHNLYQSPQYMFVATYLGSALMILSTRSIISAASAADSSI